MTDSDINELNTYINRDSGHTITDMGGASGDEFYNSFYIKMVQNYDDDTGENTSIENLTKQITYYNNAMTLLNQTTDYNGFVLNTSTQLSLHMSMEVE